MGLTAIVITKNEEGKIGPCLASLGWADEMLVLDSFSTDRTLQEASGHGARVYQRAFTTFPEQRNAALALARGRWVLFVDADERATPELHAELEAIMGARAPLAGYWVPRQNYILGHWMRHAGWYPDYQLRFFQRERGTYDEQRAVHEVVLLNGDVGHLQSPLIHYNYDRLSQFVTKQRLYSSLEATTLFRKGIRPRPHNYLLQPWREFRRRYITLQGYRDGWLGLVLSSLLAIYTFVAYRKLARLWREHDGKAHA